MSKQNKMRLVFFLLPIIILILSSCNEETLVSNQNSLGKIIINSYPKGADIFLNGVNTNKTTPDSLINLEPDYYDISLNLTGYISWLSRGRIDSNETEIINKILEEDFNYWWTVYDLNEFGFADRHVFCISVDNFNIKWMGIGDNGLAKFDDNSWTFFNQGNSGLSSKYVKSIGVDMSNHIWVGTYDGGLCKFDGVNWEVFNRQNSEIPSDRIEILKIDVNDNIWLATFEVGIGFRVVQFDGINFTVYNVDINIRDMCCTKDGYVLIAIAENGIQKFDGINWEIDNSVYDIRAMYEDYEGTIWIVDRDGRIYKGGFGNWDYVITSSGGGYRTIVYDYNDVWVGGYNFGVSKFDGEVWTDYDEVGNVEQITLDVLRHKWIATGSGVLKRK